MTTLIPRADARSETARFVVGMSRGGTTWMVRSLNLHPEVAGFGESNFWGRSFVHPGGDGTYDAARIERVRRAMRSNPLDSTIGRLGPGWLNRIHRPDIPGLVDECFSGVEAPVRPGALFVRLARAIAQAEGRSYWVDKTPQHLNHFERILAELPDARFVVMLREPYGFMLSYKHQMDRGAPERRRRFRRLYHPIACAWVWRTYMQSALRAQQRYPERVMPVYHDDIRSRPREVLRRVQEFFDLEPLVELEGMAEEVNTSFEERERPQLLEQEVFWMNAIARRQIEASPFAFREARPRFRDAIQPLATLPLWAGRLVADVQQRSTGDGLRYLWKWMFPE